MNDVFDGFIGKPSPGAAADIVSRFEKQLLRMRYVLSVTVRGVGCPVPQSTVEHLTVLRRIDLIASEHGIPLCGQVHTLGQPM